MNAPLDKGVRGFELDIHVAFRQVLPEADALDVLLALEGFTVELYRQAPAVQAGVSSARLTGPLADPHVLRAGLLNLMEGQARYLEVGLRGFLRSSAGFTEWMPWRRNVILTRTAVRGVDFQPGVKYVLE